MKSFLQSFFRKNLYLLLAATILFACAYVVNFIIRSQASINLLRNSIESFLQKREKDVIRLSQDTDLLQVLLTEQYGKSELEDLQEKEFEILFYQKNPGQPPKLKFWSSQAAAVLPDSLITGPDGHFSVTLSNGQFELIRKNVVASGNQPVLLAALIPIRWQYYIANENLKPEFAGFPKAESRVRISPIPTDFPVKSYFGNTLFYLERIESYNATKNNGLLLTMIFAAVLLLLVVVHNVAHSIAEKFGAIQGTLFLVFTILLLRTIVYLFPSLLHLRQYELFDPTIYSSNFVLRSLGDLLINALLFCWIILFIKQEIGDFKLPVFRNQWLQWLITGPILLVLVMITFIFAGIVQSLVTDARISFNVTNFFSLTVYSFVGFIVLAALALSYFFFSQILLRLVRSFIIKRSMVAYIIIGVSGLTILTFSKNPQAVGLQIFVLAWLLCYVWLMLRNMFSGLNNRLTVSEVLFWLFVFSISMSVIIIFENRKIEYLQRINFAERVAEQEDPTSEKLISMSQTYFDNDFLYPNMARFKNPEQNRMLKDSLVNNNFTTYADKYETRIYTYDSLERPLYNQDPVSFDTLNTIFQLQGKPTTVPNLKYFEKSYDKFTYIFKKPIQGHTGKPVGYLFMLADPKDFKAGGLVPELTSRRKEFLPEYSPFYSYAIYSNNNLVSYYNNYPFPTRLTDSLLAKNDYVEIKKGAFDELWHRISEDKMVVIAKKDNSIIEGITLFAWMFSSFLVLVALFWFVSVLIQTRLHWSQLKSYLQLNIRSQIHTTIIFVSLFSFIVIGIATIFFFVNRYNRTNQDSLSHSMKTVVKQIEQALPGLKTSADSTSIEKLVPREELVKLINNLAQINGIDINLYSVDGSLLVSSNPDFYTKGVLSNRMHPMAYYYVHLQNAVEYFNDEQLGTMIPYKSVYAPVRNGDGFAVAYLNIPYFSTEDELNDEISKFLVTIVNLNVFIFLIAGTIALFLTNRITSSFGLISEKMQRVNLGKANEVIEWKNNDEIGVLIKEYNKMVTKLEESAAALAKSEREGAWREMARQVAHEIKNPLTPMKLSIQYLQKAIDNNSVNVKEMTSSVAKTLVEQIDHLSKIAADFSQFANIGNPRNEVFDLHEMLYSLTSLYETTENLLFKWVPVHEKIMLYADKTQLNRLFTNLLQNALEACHARTKRVISIHEELHDDRVLIKVSDNGEGIPEEMHSKIFTPNFTTKSSGTGLGLAMSKTIVEQAKGKIWFDTVEGEGTTFYVELPVLRAT